MQKPIQVAFQGIPVSDGIEAACIEEAEKLDHYFDKITSCRVVVAQSHKHHRKGNLFEIRIELGLPGDTIAVNRVPAEHKEDEDVHVAVGEAFHKVRRQLEDYVRRRRGQVKVHAEPPRGRVVELNGQAGSGRIEDAEGRSVHFLRNAVQGSSFEQLEIGTEVRFSEEQDERGLRATSVRAIGGANPPQP